MSVERKDLAENVFGVTFIGFMVLGSFWVLQPFLPALIWAAMIVIPTWPIMLRIEKVLGGRRGRAVAVMALGLVLVILVPMWVAITTMVDNSDQVMNMVTKVQSFSMPAVPDWLKDVPYVGERITSRLQKGVSFDYEIEAGKVAPYVGSFFSWIFSRVGGFGILFLHFLLTVILACVLYAQGESAATGLTLFARRLAGAKGADSVVLAGQAIRAVALGIVVTAFAQAFVASIGMFLAGVPYAMLLTSLIFMLGVIQVGAMPVLLPVLIWLFWSAGAGWGTFMLIWTGIVVTMDNFLRPFLIRKGADLPLLLIFAGVIGGLFAFGIIGLFVGPVILAVSYTLGAAWVKEGTSAGSGNGN